MNGFVTIATGSIKYYKLAYNLLISYRKKSKKKYAFCIICDQENKYTKYFDKVIILNNATNSYLDKIELLKLVPFDQTIFIDADSLVYNDIDHYFEYFKKINVFSAFGKDVSNCPADKNAWFNPEDMKGYKSKIKYVPAFHGGIMFFKKDKKLLDLYDVAIDICNNFSLYKFQYFDKPADEPCYAVAASVYNCKPIETEITEYIFLPENAKTKNILRHKLTDKNSNPSFLLHYGTSNTKRRVYKRECRLLKAPYLFPFIYLIYFCDLLGEKIAYCFKN